MKRKGICLLTALFLTGGIYGCGAETSPEEAILGGWELVGEDDVLTLYDFGDEDYTLQKE